MNRLFCIGILTGLLMTQGANADFDATGPLEPFLWKYRIVLALGPEVKAEKIAAQLRSSKAGIDERHILWFVFDHERIRTNFAGRLTVGFLDSVRRRYFREAENAIQVRLIGKDGGVKVTASALDLEALYARIDAMPMRQLEIRKQSAGGKPLPDDSR